VFKSLFESSERSVGHSQKTCFVTFDQPLFNKARKPELSYAVVRLGEFHLLMSCICVIMAGSGLKELLMTIYADYSMDKMPIHGFYKHTF
jgi:hypothetical protein